VRSSIDPPADCSHRRPPTILEFTATPRLVDLLPVESHDRHSLRSLQHRGLWIFPAAGDDRRSYCLPCFFCGPIRSPTVMEGADAPASSYRHPIAPIDAHRRSASPRPHRALWIFYPQRVRTDIWRVHYHTVPCRFPPRGERRPTLVLLALLLQWSHP